MTGKAKIRATLSRELTKTASISASALAVDNTDNGVEDADDIMDIMCAGLIVVDDVVLWIGAAKKMLSTIVDISGYQFKI